jgi:hypothetical protein
MDRKIFTSFVTIFLVATCASGGSDILLNGTGLYLSTGDSYGLYQGYIMTLKSVGNDGSAWIELNSNDTLVNSEIVNINGFFTYNKNNRTILSLRVDNIYSGSNDRDLIYFFPVYQYIDPDMPAPEIIDITQAGTPARKNNSASSQQKAMPETTIVVFGILFILFMFYIIRKLW